MRKYFVLKLTSILALYTIICYAVLLLFIPRPHAGPSPSVKDAPLTLSPSQQGGGINQISGVAEVPPATKGYWVRGSAQVSDEQGPQAWLSITAVTSNCADLPTSLKGDTTDEELAHDISIEQASIYRDWCVLAMETPRDAIRRGVAPDWWHDGVLVEVMSSYREINFKQADASTVVLKAAAISRCTVGDVPCTASVTLQRRETPSKTEVHLWMDGTYATLTKETSYR
jgi:hypothetical protein